MNQPAKRPYRRSGLYVSGLTPEEQAAMTSVREALLTDLGGEIDQDLPRGAHVLLAA